MNAAVQPEPSAPASESIWPLRALLLLVYFVVLVGVVGFIYAMQGEL